jgi:secreted trypsin-like serine protease
MKQFTFKALLLLTLISCGKNYQEASLELKNSSIINGEKVALGEFESVVALKDRKTHQTFCSGTLVSSKIVYTASHCVVTEDDLRVLLAPLKTALGKISKAEEKKKYIQTILNRFIQVKAKQTLLEVEGRDYDLVSSAKLSENWGMSLLATLYTVFKIPLDAPLKKVFENPYYEDTAVLELKEEVSEVEIIPLLTDADMAKLKDIGSATVKLVGYGLRKDKSEIKTAQDSENFSGEKYSVDVKLTFVSPDGLKGQVGSKGFSACNGDSGGAAFIKLDDGSWRYFASLTAVSAKGCGSDFIEQFPDLDQSLNMGTTVIDLRY